MILKNCWVKLGRYHFLIRAPVKNGFCQSNAISVKLIIQLYCAWLVLAKAKIALRIAFAFTQRNARIVCYQSITMHLTEPAD